MKYLIVVSLLLSSASSFAWGNKGHRIIGDIAYKYLNNKSKKQIAKLLDGRDLAMVSTWADNVKSDRSYDKYNPWHYINAKKGQNYLESKKNPKGDAIQGIIHFEDILRNNKSTNAQKVEALKFLVHLVGDIHQPMHSGYANDRGGNDVHLTWFRQEKNLHWLWDEGLIEHQNLSYTEYVKFIHFVSKSDVNKWIDSSYLDWSNESRELLDSAYKNVGSGRYWEYKYSYLMIDKLNKRLVMSGVRLGHLLNSIFDRKKLSDKMLKARKLIKK